MAGKPKKSKNMEKKYMTLGAYIIDKYSSKNYKLGERDEVTKHPKVDQKMLDAVGGLPVLVEQAKELEREGFIKADWCEVNRDIRKFDFPMKKLPELCEREGIPDLRQKWLSCHKQLTQSLEGARTQWLRDYCKKMLESMNKGNIPIHIDDKNFWACLNGIDVLEKDVWKRRFSANILKDSKMFEKQYQGKVVTVLKRYVKDIRTLQEEIDINEEEIKECSKRVEDRVLTEFGILSYSQTLELKGSLQYKIITRQENLIDTSSQIYGTVINAQTLSNGEPVSINDVKSIITIENKACYEEREYNPEVLYIYVHGFPSPKEREFLRKLVQIAPEDTKYFHWGDMDYGGIRIFQYLKQQLFSNLMPMFMDKKTYEASINKGYGIPLEEEKRKKLEQLEAGVLEELKQSILEKGLEVEQECVEWK
ncbi:MAG: DUF2399 domain-containing protein [Lachnospiraceae bacterium]|nr:DUF2399 domain-containing protein [Lachnospiraceae bacterium]